MDELRLLAEATVRLTALCAGGFCLVAICLYLFVCASGNQPKGDQR